VGNEIDPVKGRGDSSIDKFRDLYETQASQVPIPLGDPFNPEEDIQEIKNQIQQLLPQGRGGKISQQALILILYLLSREGGDIVQEKAQSLTALSQIQQDISNLNAAICGAGAGSGSNDGVQQALDDLRDALSGVSGNSSVCDTLSGAIDQITSTIASNGGMANIWNQFVSGGPSGISAPSAMNAIMSNVGVLTQSSTSYSAQLNAEVSTSTKQYSAEQDLLGNVVKSCNQLTQAIISSTSSQR